MITCLMGYINVISGAVRSMDGTTFSQDVTAVFQSSVPPQTTHFFMPASTYFLGVNPTDRYTTLNYTCLNNTGEILYIISIYYRPFNRFFPSF